MVAETVFSAERTRIDTELLSDVENTQGRGTPWLRRLSPAGSVPAVINGVVKDRCKVGNQDEVEVVDGDNH